MTTSLNRNHTSSASDLFDYICFWFRMALNVVLTLWASTQEWQQLNTLP